MLPPPRIKRLCTCAIIMMILPRTVQSSGVSYQESIVENDRSDKWVPCSHRNFREKANHHCISSVRVKRGRASYRFGKRIPRIRRNRATRRSSAGPAHARALASRYAQAAAYKYWHPTPPFSTPSSFPPSRAQLHFAALAPLARWQGFRTVHVS